MCTPALMATVYDGAAGPPACTHHHGAAAEAALDPDGHLPVAATPAAATATAAGAAAGATAAYRPLRPTRRTILRGLIGAAAVPAVVGGVGLVTPAVAAAAPARQLVPSAVHEMTHRLTRDFPVVRGLVEQPVIEQIKFIDVDGFNANQITFNEHSGTHLDPPGHFRTGEPTADELEVERLVVPLVVVDIAARAAGDADTELTIDDIRGHERAHGRLPRGCMVAMNSGWTQRVTQPGAFLNEGPDGLFHFPGFCVEAAQFLIHEREVTAIASDTPSLDRGAADAPHTHRAWLPTGRYGIEVLHVGADVPARGATVVVGGPRHEGSFGGPVRVLALVP